MTKGLTKEKRKNWQCFVYSVCLRALLECNNCFCLFMVWKRLIFFLPHCKNVQVWKYDIFKITKFTLIVSFVVDTCPLLLMFACFETFQMFWNDDNHIVGRRKLFCTQRWKIHNKNKMSINKNEKHNVSKRTNAVGVFFFRVRTWN